MSATADPTSAVVVMTGISKAFGPNAVLRSVDFVLRRGEVHALLGENGAGKSTLMKILIGVHAPDAGSVLVAGRAVGKASTRQRIDAGVAMIFQELSLVPTMTVAENVFLGREPRRAGWRADRAAMREATRSLAESHGFELSPDDLVEDLPFAARQLVEILKALSRGAQALVMDEPTSSLTVREEDMLHAIVDGLKEKGIGIVYITHRMAEIARVADRLSIIKDGEIAGPFAVGELSPAEIARLMARKPASVAGPGPPRRPRPGEVVLRVTKLTTARKLKDVDLAIRAGEIVGLAGLVGSGRSTLLKALFGLIPDASGEVVIGGRTVSGRSPRAHIEAGAALVPEDRRLEGLVADHSLETNVGLPNLPDLLHKVLPGAVSRRRERDLFLHYRKALSIACRGAGQAASELSGGNQQKIVFAKWFGSTPKLLLLDEPTAGVDVNAKAEMRSLVRTAAEAGVGILVVSSELDELAELSDRMVMVSDGALRPLGEGALGEEEIRVQLPTSQKERAA